MLSIDCRPRFELTELAEAMGEEGRVYGIDRSEAMLALVMGRSGIDHR